MAAHWENVALARNAAPVMAMRTYKGAARSKSQPLVLYFAGGAFQSEGLSNEERPLARMIADSGAVVVEADYASPSHNAFPGAMEWGFKALACLSGRRKQFGGGRSPLFVMGEEAGGNVAAGVALKARDGMPGELAGQVLLSPMVDPMMTSASIRGADAIGMRDRWSEGWRRYLGSGCRLIHPYAAPCECSRLAGVAPALVMSAQDDPLRDETLGYAERLQQSGVAVSRHVLPAGLGWAGLYRNGEGAWLQEIGIRFQSFVEQLTY